jgi:hypothetical protein
VDDDEEEDDEPPKPILGHAEPSDSDHKHSGWLYVPDLASETGWINHEFPLIERPRQPRVGFRRT